MEQPVTSTINLINQDPEINEDVLINLFKTFITDFNNDTINYYKQLHFNIAQSLYEITLNLDHISSFSPVLYTEFMHSPTKIIRIFEKGLNELTSNVIGILLTSSGKITPIRHLNSSCIQKVVKVQGIVTSASSVSVKPSNLYLQCRTCHNSIIATTVIPRSCTSTCPVDPFIIVPDKSEVVDSQLIKLQETFDEIPVSETPRSVSVILEKSLVNRVIPGNNITVLGIMQVSNDRSVIKGLSIENRLKGSSLSFSTNNNHSFSLRDEQLFKEMSKSENFYNKLISSIAPGIYGHEDIKKAICCLLFGGNRKVKDDGIVLRGDINVLLIGDPSLGKSQFLKFTEQVAPNGVYTSGKGSSAAGLTASVLRDSKTGEFYLEGGALVLADQGVCCIDEFDKMRESDRVSIHEAMEQQTISIAKGGITTILNTRASILAAANPAFGRFDEFRNLRENIDFSSTILSRFDCVFVLKDKICAKSDEAISKFILTPSSSSSSSNNEKTKLLKDEKLHSDHFSVDLLKSYIVYAKNKIKPIIGKEAKFMLSSYYCSIREQNRNNKSNKSFSAIPITVRQLEALVRLAEAVARIHLSDLVTTVHVEEAIRIFQSSTMHSVSQGHHVEGMYRPNFHESIKIIEKKIIEFMPIGITKSYSDLVEAIGISDEFIINKTIDSMKMKNKLISSDFGKKLVRMP